MKGGGGGGSESSEQKRRRRKRREVKKNPAKRTLATHRSRGGAGITSRARGRKAICLGYRRDGYGGRGEEGIQSLAGGGGGGGGMAETQERRCLERNTAVCWRRRGRILTAITRLWRGEKRGEGGRYEIYI